MGKSKRRSVPVLFAEKHVRRLDHNRTVVDNRVWWCYKVRDEKRGQKITEGRDEVIVKAEASLRFGYIQWSDVQTQPKKVWTLLGSRGLQLLRQLMQKKEFAVIDELHVTSAWQIEILTARGKWCDPHKLMLPILRKMLGRRVIVEKWHLPDVDVRA